MSDTRSYGSTGVSFFWRQMRNYHDANPRDWRAKIYHYGLFMKINRYFTASVEIEVATRYKQNFNAHHFGLCDPKQQQVCWHVWSNGYKYKTANRINLP